MIKKVSYHILFFVLTINLNISAVVFESSNLTDIYKYLDQDSIVVFDIDNTITELPMGIEPWVKHKTSELTKKGLNKEEALDFVLTMFFTITKLLKLIPIGSAPEIIQDLQKKDLPVIALTNRSIPIAERTVRLLKNINIDLSENKLYEKDLDLSVTHAGKFSHGIIFTGKNDKGKMLFLFFNTVNYTPKKIIFIDDGMYNITSVEKACKENNVEFVGIRFSLMDKMKKAFNLKKAEKNVNKLKMKLGFYPLQPVDKDDTTKKMGWPEYIWNIIAWPFKKIGNLFK